MTNNFLCDTIYKQGVKMLNNKDDIEIYNDYYIRTKNGFCFLVKPDFENQEYRIVALTKDNEIIKVESPKKEQLENALLNLFLQKTHKPKKTDDFLEIGLVQSLYVHLFDVALSKKWDVQTFVEKLGIRDNNKTAQKAIEQLVEDVLGNIETSKKTINENQKNKKEVKFMKNERELIQNEKGYAYVVKPDMEKGYRICVYNAEENRYIEVRDPQKHHLENALLNVAYQMKCESKLMEEAKNCLIEDILSEKDANLNKKANENYEYFVKPSLNDNHYAIYALSKEDERMIEVRDPQIQHMERALINLIKNEKSLKNEMHNATLALINDMEETKENELTMKF